MRKIKLLFLVFLAPLLASAQQVTGDWYGLLKVQGMELPLIFHITETEGNYSATMDSPAQKAFGMPVSSVTFIDGQLDLQIANIGAQYKGALSDSKIKGKFYQANQSFQLDLSTEPIAERKIVRPQEPTKPYPYYAEEVSFSSEEGEVTLAGTLSLPKNKENFPTAILISGSGPQNRDEEFMTHKPFLVLADYLTRQGIAVLRYDDRGFGASTGDHNAATSADFANDVKAAVRYLKNRNDINPEKIGLIGHSEGGLIAPLVAADIPMNFIVLLAGPGVTGEQISIQQIELLGKLKGADEQDIKNEVAVMQGIFELVKNNEENMETLKNKLEVYIGHQMEKNKVVIEGMSTEEYIEKQIAQLTRPWLLYFLNHDPRATLVKVECPVLAINGAKDVQVGPSNLEVIKKALLEGGNKKVTVKEFENMNHLFQICETGSMEEYAQIETTMEPLVLETVSSWINKQN
ncbi:alpha/beta fold hydrolase [Marivirga harenae]|uniref:alpha/beta hydrolase family protein n=1 Tax=Marivirga harenae TaxID=2010992 RepID=UPI0026E07B34|nr:alpha/beta fold hydrolase [Marivirga harenae]WKV12355.1 alpha/beta fold hydrolase [Marivirga harenae]|tara:strand:+ start:45384 stop:46769 length:1386 start_codon:yes stop_codon:yes gene_type:complete